MRTNSSKASTPAERLVEPDFIGLLNHSFEVERDSECGPKSRLAYLSQHIFDFTTYDSSMDEMFAEHAVAVCAAINDAKTFEYIADAEHYKWFLLMCNMPFFASRLSWGTSIRGAWWDHCEHEIKSCGIWRGDKPETVLKFSREDWVKFIAAVVAFAGGQ